MTQTIRKILAVDSLCDPKRKGKRTHQQVTDGQWNYQVVSRPSKTWKIIHTEAHKNVAYDG